MHSLWHWILWMLAALAADPAVVQLEQARAAGCVAVAYSSLTPDVPPAPKKQSPPAPVRCEKCDGSGRIYRPDGGYVKCSCGACTTGTCPKKNLP
jgi:hypothetical protein